MKISSKPLRCFVLFLAWVGVHAGDAVAEDPLPYVFSPVVERAPGPYDNPPVRSHYGGVGLLKTRSARMAPDSTLTSMVAWNSAQQRYSLTFQAAPWLETTFSYSGFDLPGRSTFDRQFDIKMRLWEESLYIPEIAIGLQDFLGTGIFSGEYIVANKRFGPFDLSLGVGWGRLASRGTVSNPLSVIHDGFNTRDGISGVGGEVNFGRFFRGEEIGVFGGVVYDTPVDGLRLIAEYDSDRNFRLDGLDDNPFNFGLVYDVFPSVQIGASYLAQDEFTLTAAISPVIKEEIYDPPPGDRPPAFYVREARSDYPRRPGNWIAPVQPLIFTPASRSELPGVLEKALEGERLTLMRMQTGSDALRVVIRNGRYRPQPKAVGRAMRILSRYAPAEIETFQVAIDQRGIETAEFFFERSELETLARQSGYSVTPPGIEWTYITPGSRPVDAEELNFATYPNYDYGIQPDIRYNTFDPSDPLRLQLVIEGDASVEVVRGLHLTGAVAAPVFDLLGDFDDILVNTSSQLPQVRTNFGRYNDETDIGIYRLTAEYLFSPYPNVYAKLTAGLVEQMFGAVGGEVLWRPPNSRLAWGVEAYYARQRGFDTLFSFQDYDVITGHASVYWDTPYNDWNVALHAGRYLAKDLGATLEVTRRFPNGWEVGAFATLTDVPFDEFGEGSFDKGLTVRIPLDWALPNDSRSASRVLIRPIQRDGGARLNVPGRLSGLTQTTSRGEVTSQWDTFAH